MKTFFGFFFLAIYLLITFLHIWGFWRVYKSSFGDLPGFAAMGRGFIAGAVTNFFVSLLAAYLLGGYSFIMIIYGLPFSIPIGIFFTVCFWWIITKLELKIGFWGRGTLGIIIGFIVGIAVGTYLDSRSPLATSSAISAMVIYWTLISLTSAIMAGKREYK
ncbi:MAG: hypothetical protein M3Q78_00150 [Acidobacteriota bacterium]|nr:hypothetical protein [Acidobacteriota bacterium]